MIEQKYWIYTGKNRYANAIAESTANALKDFCIQEPEFYQAVENSSKTFDECLEEIVKGIGSSISDLEVYRKAVQYYFPTADIHFKMEIDTCGNIEGAAKEQHDAAPIKVSLDSLLDF